MIKENNIEPKPSNWDSDKILSIAAIFISLLSLLAISYQSYLGREENKLMKIQQSASVLPYLSTWFSGRDNEFRFIVENKGVGPAFIKEVNFKFFDAEKQDTLYFNNSDGLISTVRKQSQLLGSIPMTSTFFRANTLLAKGEIRELFVFHTNSTKQEYYLARKEYDKFSIEHNIIYEDVYGTQWTLNSSKGYPIKIED